MCNLCGILSVVVNYDVDVLLQPEVYLDCQNKILAGVDLIYPYFWGDSQYQVNYSGRNLVQSTGSLANLESRNVAIARSEYGHCQFFNAKSYRAGGMENESFISYGPEDKERGLRFKKLGYKVQWENNYVYHLEHTRGSDSSTQNPHMDHNNRLFTGLEKLNKEELRNHYNRVAYINKYIMNEKEEAQGIFFREVSRWFADGGDATFRLNYNLNSDSTVLDIGGFQGGFASDIYSMYKPTIHVFEPIKKHADFISNRFKLNDSINIHNVALGNRNSHETIIVSAESSSLFIDSTGKQMENIEILAFNEYVDDIEHVGLAKINIEGSEFDLLESISDKNLIKLENLQIQFHTFVDNCITRRDAIRARLQKTHVCTYCYDFVWENWELKK